MTLSTDRTSESSVEISALFDIIHSFVLIQLIQTPQKRQSVDRDIAESRVYLPERIAGKDTGWLLERQYDCTAEST
jgi:hypothetical protein